MKFIAHAIFILLLCLAGVFICAGLGARIYQNTGPIGAFTAREFPAEVRAWKIGLGEKEGECVRLGPLVPRAEPVPVDALSILGLPDTYDERSAQPGISKYYGLGLQLAIGWMPRDPESLSQFKGIAVLKPGILPEGEMIINTITLGNPGARSADDPWVRACPFEFENGLKLGATRAEFDALMPWGSTEKMFQGDHPTPCKTKVQVFFAQDRLVGINMVSYYAGELDPAGNVVPTPNTQRTGGAGARPRPSAPSELGQPVLPSAP